MSGQKNCRMRKSRPARRTRPALGNRSPPRDLHREQRGDCCRAAPRRCRRGGRRRPRGARDHLQQPTRRDRRQAEDDQVGVPEAVLEADRVGVPGGRSGSSVGGPARRTIPGSRPPRRSCRRGPCPGRGTRRRSPRQPAGPAGVREPLPAVELVHRRARQVRPPRRRLRAASRRPDVSARIAARPASAPGIRAAGPRPPRRSRPSPRRTGGRPRPRTIAGMVLEHRFDLGGEGTL